jgi:hypothetical protein
VSDFDPNDPLYYTIEHCFADPHVKQLRWVNDNSVNLEYYSKEDATLALGILTHPDIGNTSNLSAQEPRKAKPYSKKPNSALIIRQSNAGDQKPKGAARTSTYYQRNPDVAGNREREPRRRPPPKQEFLNYDDDEVGSRESARRWSSGDASMEDGSGADRRGPPRRNGRDNRDNRERRDTRGRGGRGGRSPAGGRFRSETQAKDVDSYRPGSRGYVSHISTATQRTNPHSPREPQFGRLRGRSASPASDEEGDGRFGFAETDAHAGRRYRSRSRSNANPRRRREPSTDRWTHDRANYDSAATGTGRWQKDAFFVDTSPMGNHHRSNAIDVSNKPRGGGGESLLSRMTKNGKPLVPQEKRSLADRMTRDDDESFRHQRDEAPRQQKRSLAERMTRNDDEPFGRLTRDDDMQDRGRGRRDGSRGISIKGEADRGAPGFSIRGVANGA